MAAPDRCTKAAIRATGSLRRAPIRAERDRLCRPGDRERDAVQRERGDPGERRQAERVERHARQPVALLGQASRHEAPCGHRDQPGDRDRRVRAGTRGLGDVVQRLDGRHRDVPAEPVVRNQRVAIAPPAPSEERERDAADREARGPDGTVDGQRERNIREQDGERQRDEPDVGRDARRAWAAMPAVRCAAARKAEPGQRETVMAEIGQPHPPGDSQASAR